MKYEEAMQKLETISRELEGGNIPIDEMATKLKEAGELIKFCKGQLLAVEEQLKDACSADDL